MKARHSTEHLYNMIKEGLIDHEDVVNSCLSYMSDCDVQDMMEKHRIIDQDDWCFDCWAKLRNDMDDIKSELDDAIKDKSGFFGDITESLSDQLIKFFEKLNDKQDDKKDSWRWSYRCGIDDTSDDKGRCSNQGHVYLEVEFKMSNWHSNSYSKMYQY